MFSKYPKLIAKWVYINLIALVTGMEMLSGLREEDPRVIAWIKSETCPKTMHFGILAPWASLLAIFGAKWHYGIITWAMCFVCLAVRVC